LKKKGALRLLIGIALLPACIGATQAVLNAAGAVTRSSSSFSMASIALFCGYLIWIALWILLPRPARSYVLAHELTHAVVALLCGADVSRIKVTENGGYVSLSKSNIWITLSPYFFPFYTFLVVTGYLITALFITPVPWKPLWYFLIGFTWSYHTCFTLNSLLIHQPDIKVYGRVFSYVFIYLLNLIVIALWLVATTPTETRTLAASFLAHTCSTYALIAEGCAALLRKTSVWLR